MAQADLGIPSLDLQRILTPEMTDDSVFGHGGTSCRLMRSHDSLSNAKAPKSMGFPNAGEWKQMRVVGAESNGLGEQDVW